MNEVLVTGGAGYIGSFTAQSLIHSGYKVAVLDNLSTGHRAAIPDEAEFINLDLNDQIAVRHHFMEHGPYYGVIHFAAKSLVGESVQQPGLYYQNNVVGSLNLVAACAESGTGNIVFSSTAAVYGEPQGELVEDHRKHPINPYGNTKLAVEKMLEDMAVASNGTLRAIALRYFNACGADSAGSRGEDHNPETHLVPIAIRAAMGLRGPMKVFGNDYPTKDGTAVRDYVNVHDLADAHIKALERCQQNVGPFEAFNVGTGRGNSVLEVIEAVKDVVGSPVPYSFGDRRAGDPAALVANSTKLQQTLGWNPKFPLISSVAQAFEFFRRNPSGYGDK